MIMKIAEIPVAHIVIYGQEVLYAARGHAYRT